MEVIRVPAADQLKPLPKLCVRTFFILHDVLSEEVLIEALDGLIRNHWRKLGARLATRREDGLLEYHLPHTFDEKYTLFNWSSTKHDNKSIDSIGLPKAPAPEKGATLLPSLYEPAEEWLSPSGWPLDRTQEKPETPLLYVHLSTFDDGSCLAVNLPHVVGDQFGLSNFMKAWLGMTRGETPPPMVGVTDDYLALGKPYEAYRREEVVRKRRQRVRRKGEYPFVVLGFIPDLVLHRKEKTHTLFLPLPLVQSLRQRASKSLAEKDDFDAGISDNDIITAILLKVTRMHHTSPRTLALSQSINLRNRTPLLQNPLSTAYIHNAIHYSTACLPHLSPATPLSTIAHANRTALNLALDPKDIEIGRVVTRELVKRGQPLHICEPFERSFHVTSWTAAWKGLDFGDALLVAGEKENEEKKVEGREEERYRPASELLVLGSGHARDAPARFHTTIMCKTSEGYWINVSAPVKAMTLLEDFLKRDPMLETL